jgi:hypothetical protein
MDVVARAICPACIEQPMASATAHFSGITGIFFFRAAPAFLVRLLTRFFVSHNMGLSFVLCY